MNVPEYGRKEKDVKDFKFELSKWAPFQDRETSERVRRIRRDDICKHDNAARLSSWQDLQKPLIKGNSRLYRQQLTTEEIQYVEPKCRTSIRT
jgi:hypothetical protein